MASVFAATNGSIGVIHLATCPAQFADAQAYGCLASTARSAINSPLPLVKTPKLERILLVAMFSCLFFGKAGIDPFPSFFPIAGSHHV